MDNERRIIYVDAGNLNSENFKISLYDIKSNATHIMDLPEVLDNNEAEKYAVYYAILYINKKGFTNCMILSDNKSAVGDIIIQSLLNELNTQVSWIPREINKIADKTVKRDATLHECEFNTLKLFINLAKKAYRKADDKTKMDVLKIKELKEELEKKSKKILNQAKQITNLKKKCEKK